MSLAQTIDRYRRGIGHRLLLLDYRHFQRIYWEIRAPELQRAAVVSDAEDAALRGVLERHKVRSIMDLGCGSGRLVPSYRRAGVDRITGVDIAERALATVRELYPEVETVRTRAESVPAEGQFDAVVSTRVLQHIHPTDLPEVLDRITQAARKLIYLNEITASEPADISGARYMFRHDYIWLMSARGWVLSEKDIIPGTDQTYLTFVPGPAYRAAPPGAGRGGYAKAIRRWLRPAGRQVNRLFAFRDRMVLRWIYLRESIDGVQIEIRNMRSRHADALRQFGASVAEDAAIIGPLSIVNSRDNFSNLTIGSRTHIGSEVFFDLADKITIEDGATLSMRVIVITHLDVGRGPLIFERPRLLAPVRICEGAFIGANATILHGVTIGPRAVVAAGAVVTRDIPGGVVVRRDGKWRRRPARTTS